MPHANNPKIIARLKRAEGHLRSIITMVEEGRSCLDLAQQLHAVEAAVGSAKTEMIQHHIEHCLEEKVGTRGAETRELLGELKTLTKYL